MATIRVRDWTKRRLDEISEAEGHSSHDSVVKSLLKDRQLAQFAGEPAGGDTEEADADPPGNPPDRAFDDLTVLGEFAHADNGLLFLWCPNCGNEIAHIELDNPVTMSVFEVECQRCLTRLDHHAIVAIEIGYPIEERSVEGGLQADLQACVVDYWDRKLAAAGDGDDGTADEDHLVWQFTEYLAEFGWEWPADVPVVGFRPGEVYRDERTGQVVEVVESLSEDPRTVGAVRVTEYPDREAYEADDGDTVTLDPSSAVTRITRRDLVPLS